MTRKLHSAHSDGPSGPLHQYRTARYFAPDMYSAMSRDAGYAQACPLIRSHVRGQGSDMIERDHGKLCSCAERPIGLCAVTPHRTADPFGRHTLADLIDMPCAIAMRNHARVSHTVAKGILTLFDISGVYTRGCDPNADLASLRTRVGHFAHHQNFPRRSLPFVPSCPHLEIPPSRNYQEQADSGNSRHEMVALMSVTPPSARDCQPHSRLLAHG